MYLNIYFDIYAINIMVKNMKFKNVLNLWFFYIFAYFYNINKIKELGNFVLL